MKNVGEAMRNEEVEAGKKSQRSEKKRERRVTDKLVGGDGEQEKGLWGRTKEKAALFPYSKV